MVVFGRVYRGDSGQSKGAKPRTICRRLTDQHQRRGKVEHIDLSDPYAAAVDLGATNLRVALGLRDGTFIAKKSEPTGTVSGDLGISRQIIRMTRSIQRENHVPERNFCGIGIGSIGPLNPIKGGIDRPANISQYGFIPLVGPLHSEFGVPVKLLNDCSAAVIGEKQVGAGTGEDNLVYITISSGIGAGVYVDGHLLSGKDGNAHEVGHMVIDSGGKLLCGCGRRGHWEAYCSGRNIPDYARLFLQNSGIEAFKKTLLYEQSSGELSNLSAKTIYECAAQGDELCTRFLEEVGRLNAIGFANVANLYDPALITVGGSVALNNSALTLEPVIAQIGDYVFNRPPKIQVTPLGEDIVLVGALVVAFGFPDS